LLPGVLFISFNLIVVKRTAIRTDLLKRTMLFNSLDEKENKVPVHTLPVD
jgi:hypothetical protein